MKSALLPSLLALVLGLSLVGCADESCPADGPVPPPPNDCPNTVSLLVRNESGTDISTLLLSPSSTDAWGNNQLDELLFDGEQLTLRCVPCGKEYDVKALSGTLEIAEEFEIFLRCGTQPSLTIE